MTKTVHSLLLFIIYLSFSGCAIYEDVYFHKDKSVTYSLKIEGSEIMKLAPTANALGNIPTDTIISLVQIMEEKDDLRVLLNDDKDLRESILPLSMKFASDTLTNTIYATLSGNFKNTEALNKAFSTLNKISKERKSQKETWDISGTKGIPEVEFPTAYEWDGKVMKRKVIYEKSEEESLENKQESTSYQNLFSSGKTTIRYHFPKRIKTTSNENALFSKDGKTIVFECPSPTFISPKAKDLNIEIKVK